MSGAAICNEQLLNLSIPVSLYVLIFFKILIISVFVISCQVNVYFFYHTKLNNFETSNDICGKVALVLYTIVEK